MDDQKSSVDALMLKSLDPIKSWQKPLIITTNEQYADSQIIVACYYRVLLATVVTIIALAMLFNYKCYHCCNQILSQLLLLPNRYNTYDL